MREVVCAQEGHGLPDDTLACQSSCNISRPCVCFREVQAPCGPTILHGNFRVVSCLLVCEKYNLKINSDNIVLYLDRAKKRKQYLEAYADCFT